MSAIWWASLEIAAKDEVLAALDLPEDEPGILLRKEALGNDDVEVAGQPDQAQGRQQGRELVAEDEAQAAVVGTQRCVERALGEAIEAAGRMQSLLL